MSKKTIILCLLGCFMMCGVLVLSAVHFGQARKPHHTKVAKSYTVSQEKKKKSVKRVKTSHSCSNKKYGRKAEGHGS